MDAARMQRVASRALSDCVSLANEDEPAFLQGLTPAERVASILEMLKWIEVVVRNEHRCAGRRPELLAAIQQMRVEVKEKGVTAELRGRARELGRGTMGDAAGP